MSITEGKNPLSEGIDGLPVAEILRLMHRDNASVMAAIESALPDIAKAVDSAVSVIRGGGRVFYIGAGTSGRLGVLDASEIHPTFGVDCFKAIIAGGDAAIVRAVEGAEDDVDAGKMAGLAIRPDDMAIGISASGSTPFVLAALKAANDAGAVTWIVTCNEIEPRSYLDGEIKLLTGPEIIAGSTRLKAGTAAKICLNMLSTATMIKMGGVYDGLMVDVVPSNRKLISRAERIIAGITGCGMHTASEYLKTSGLRPKVAALMIKRGLSKQDAEQRLKESGGSLRKCL